jgi:hypothetical protein
MVPSVLLALDCWSFMTNLAHLQFLAIATTGFAMFKLDSM